MRIKRILKKLYKFFKTISFYLEAIIFDLVKLNKLKKIKMNKKAVIKKKKESYVLQTFA